MTCAPASTDGDTEEFVWAKPHEVERRIAEGWRVCEGWQNAEHHLRYSVPMSRPVK